MSVLFREAPTADGVNPYDAMGLEAPDMLAVTSDTREELARNLRYCSTVRGMSLLDLSAALDEDYESVERLVLRGDGAFSLARRMFEHMRAQAVSYPPVDSTGRFI